MQIPSGEWDLRIVGEGDAPETRDPEGMTGASAPSRLSAPCFLQPETQKCSPSVSVDDTDPLSQNLDADVGNPISFQKSWTRFSFDF
jgi:hypothetical protein